MNTKAGGKKVAATNIRKYGEDYYRNIGALGGKSYDKFTSPLRGFAAMSSEKRHEISLKGNKASRRKIHGRITK